MTVVPSVVIFGTPQEPEAGLRELVLVQSRDVVKGMQVQDNSHASDPAYFPNDWEAGMDKLERCSLTVDVIHRVVRTVQEVSLKKVMLDCCGRPNIWIGDFEIL